MDDQLQKIKDYYYSEYYQKIRDEDKGFLNRTGKFIERNKESLWGVGGLAAVGVVAAGISFGAIVAVPAGIALLVGVVGSEAVASRAQSNAEFDTAIRLLKDIESGVLVERYKEEALKKSAGKTEELTKLEECEAVVKFQAAAKREKEEAKAGKTLAEQRQEKLKAAQPKKVNLKK